MSNRSKLFYRIGIAATGFVAVWLFVGATLAIFDHSTITALDNAMAKVYAFLSSGH